MKKYLMCMIAGMMSLIGCGVHEPQGELLSVEYTHSGTMAGYIYEGRVKQNPDGRYVLTAMKENYGPLYRKQISKEAVDSFRQIIIDEKMYKYKEHYRPSMEVLDGEGWHFAAKFSDGTHGPVAMALAAFKDICKGRLPMLTASWKKQKKNKKLFQDF